MFPHYIVHTALKSASTRNSAVSHKERPKSTKPDLTLQLDTEKDDAENIDETVILVNGDEFKAIDSRDEEPDLLSSRSQSSRREKLDISIRPKTVPANGRSR